MFSNRTLQIAFFMSLATHVVVVAQSPGYLFFSPQAVNKKIEINYIKLPKQEKLEAKRAVPLKNEPFLKLPERPGLGKRTPPPFVERAVLSKGTGKQLMPKTMLFDRPILIKPDIIAIKKKITLPAVGIGKINSPSYLSYYQIVREKIRRAAYRNYNRNETGEVYITFVVSSEGYLKDVRLVEDKSLASTYLKEVASSSVTAASPFPNFPKELDYSQLSFNVVISFEIE